jgi:hypothetical protein
MPGVAVHYDHEAARLVLRRGNQLDIVALESGTIVRTIPEHARTGIARFDRAGRFLALLQPLASGGSMLEVWDVSNGELVGSRRLEIDGPETSDPSSNGLFVWQLHNDRLAITPDGRLAAVLQGDDVFLVPSERLPAIEFPQRVAMGGRAAVSADSGRAVVWSQTDPTNTLAPGSLARIDLEQGRVLGSETAVVVDSPASYPDDRMPGALYVLRSERASEWLDTRTTQAIPLRALPSGATLLAAAPSLHRALFAQRETPPFRLALYDTSSGAAIATFPLAGHEDVSAVFDERTTILVVQRWPEIHRPVSIERIDARDGRVVTRPVTSPGVWARYALLPLADPSRDLVTILRARAAAARSRCRDGRSK